MSRLLRTSGFSAVDFRRLLAALLFMIVGSLPFTIAWGQEVAANQPLRRMIAIAADNGGVEHTEELNALKQQIESAPKPARGNRSLARKANDQALQAFNAGQYEQAKQFWMAAQQADPGDVEITNNLGMIYLKVSDFPQALKMLSTTLRMSPGRSAAWANLAEYFALQEKPQQAVACYALAFHFSQNQDKTRNFLQQRASSGDTPQVRQAAQQALQLSLIQGGGSVAPAIAKSASEPAAEDSLDAPLPSAPPATHAAPPVTAPVLPPVVAAPVTPPAPPPVVAAPVPPPAAAPVTPPPPAPDAVATSPIPASLLPPASSKADVGAALPTTGNDTTNAEAGNNDLVERVAQGMGTVVYPMDIQTYLTQGPLGDRHTES